MNNAGFEIEKSLNGKDFETIGFVEGNCNTVEEIAYNFIDNNPSNGTSYYRLKQIDFDGTYDYSVIIAVDFIKQVSFKIFPNPVRDNLIIQGLLNDEVNVAIIGMKGQILYEGTARIEDNLSVDVSSLNQGLYYVQIRNKVGLIYKELFVKE